MLEFPGEKDFAAAPKMMRGEWVEYLQNRQARKEGKEEEKRENVQKEIIIGNATSRMRKFQINRRIS